MPPQRPIDDPESGVHTLPLTLASGTQVVHIFVGEVVVPRHGLAGVRPVPLIPLCLIMLGHNLQRRHPRHRQCMRLCLRLRDPVQDIPLGHGVTHHQPEGQGIPEQFHAQWSRLLGCWQRRHRRLGLLCSFFKFILPPKMLCQLGSHIGGHVVGSEVLQELGLTHVHRLQVVGHLLRQGPWDPGRILVLLQHWGAGIGQHYDLRDLRFQGCGLDQVPPGVVQELQLVPLTGEEIHAVAKHADLGPLPVPDLPRLQLLLPGQLLQLLGTGFLLRLLLLLFLLCQCLQFFSEAIEGPSLVVRLVALELQSRLMVGAPALGLFFDLSLPGVDLFLFHDHFSLHTGVSLLLLIIIAHRILLLYLLFYLLLLPCLCSSCRLGLLVCFGLRPRLFGLPSLLHSRSLFSLHFCNVLLFELFQPPELFACDAELPLPLRSAWGVNLLCLFWLRGLGRGVLPQQAHRKAVCVALALLGPLYAVLVSKGRQARFPIAQQPQGAVISHDVRSL
mmetsp:Transcript_54118/g.90157  ORF Transcript_54118/g.90157 Transcript_54118/m.90157 type:complete len:502 (-) Transcript_54118:2883-4388(-)